MTEIKEARFEFRLEKSLKTKFDAKCKKNKTEMSDMLRQCVRNYINGKHENQVAKSE